MMSQISQYHDDFINLDIINRQKSILQRSKNELRTKKSFQRKEKTLALKEVQKCYNCEKFRHLSQQCKKSCSDKKKTVATTSHNSLNWTACQNDICEIYMSDKNEVRWYSQKQQKKHRSYNITEVSIKEIAILEQINVEEVDIHGTQKEDFPEYNKEIYISEDYKFNETDIEQRKI